MDSTAAHDDSNNPGRGEQDVPVRENELAERQDEPAVYRDSPAGGDDVEVIIQVIQPGYCQGLNQALHGTPHLGDPRGADWPEDRDHIDMFHAGQEARPAASPSAAQPELRDRVDMHPGQDRAGPQPPSAQPEPRDRVDMPLAEHRARSDETLPLVHPGQRDQIEQPNLGSLPPPPPPPAAVGPDQRERIELPQSAPAVPEADSAGELRTRVPQPVILVGNPRLGSAPGKPSRAKRSPADSVLDGARTKNFTVRAASLRGDEHRYNCDPRQDSIGLWALDRPAWLGSGGDLLLLCVADGVGNCPLSHLGSAEACWLLRQHVEAHLEALTTGETREVGCRRVIDEVAAGLRVLADNHGLGPKDVSTTLIAALIVPGSEQQGSAATALVFYVGDSPGFVLRERRWISIPKKADPEEAVHSTGTDALPTRAQTCHAEAHDLFAGDMFMLCSDGLSNPMDHNESVQNQLADWWGGEPPSLPEFYWQMSFRAQTYGDDRSAVCVWVDA